VIKSIGGSASSRSVVTRALLFVTGAALTVTGCGTSNSSANGSGGPAAVTTITVGIPAAITADAVLVARDKGYFTQHQLKVNVETLNGGAANVPALQGGAIQIAQSNVLSEIQGAAQGLAVPCFAGAFALTPTGSFLPLVASAKSGITKPAQLAGKTIAVNATGGVNQLLTDAWLAQQGVAYKSVHYIGMGFPDMPVAIGSGRVDAAVSVEPFGTEMRQQGATLLSGYLESNIQGSPTFSCWNATASWLAKNQKVAGDFVAAIQQANDFINNEPGQFRTYLEKTTKIAPKVIQALSLPNFTTNMSNADVTEWEAAGHKYGILTGGAVDLAKVYQPVAAS
jgi:NitT/TauT family transport system substrate-binding protein